MSFQRPYPSQQPPKLPPPGPAQHRAGSRSRVPFWLLAAFHALVVLFLVAAGKYQSFDETFAILGSGAAVDVMAAVMWWAWHGGPSRRD